MRDKEAEDIFKFIEERQVGKKIEPARIVDQAI